MEDSPRKWPGWKMALLMPGAMVLLFFFVLGIYTGLSAAVLSDAMEEAEALGGPVTIEAILKARPTWPEGRNGADVILAIKPTLDATEEALDKSEKDLAAELPVFGCSADPELGRRWWPETAGVGSERRLMNRRASHRILTGERELKAE